MAAIEYRGANAVTNFDISNYVERLKKKGVFPFPESQTNQQEEVLAEAKQEVQEVETREAKEEPIEEVKEYVEEEEVQEKKVEQQEEEFGVKEDEVVNCCIDSSAIMEMERSSNHNTELDWNFCMMDSTFAPFLTEQNLTDKNPIEYPELFNELGFEDNIDFMFEEGAATDCLSLENVECIEDPVVGRESPTSSSSPLSCSSTDSALSTMTTTTTTSASCNYSV